ncbi:CsbD family protein [Nitrosococcus halophilus Nc 4]|uniref:CsbD family protein n=1 Tax=Nitrosococcus halophilus (strain Nc4) TaxID=472759 RepID=D5C1U3_NITHN|nr:CsbD family protein [Nitrosococcus halophilus Nc 4]
MAINWDQIKGNWKQFSGKIRQQWGQLTDDEIDEIAGNRDILVGKLQERYGIGREEAERQLEDFTNSL